MRLWVIAGCCLLLLACGLERPATAQVTGGETPQIVWEVKSRFRLFRNERDFERQLAAHRGDGELAAEARLARATDGRGWARELIGQLCLDAAGRLLESCVRDGTRENYLAPAEHRVGVVVADAPAHAACTWMFDDGDSPSRKITLPCDEEVRLWVRYGRPTTATVELIPYEGAIQEARTEILVRDVLIVGMGDSVASGDGNPDRPISLSDDGFCFRRFLARGGGAYFRPGRAGFRGDKTCDTPTPKAESDWAKHGAGWIGPACHRSLYNYQTRTALALAVEHPQLAVTYVPLGCTGATIADGVLGPLRAREVVCDGKSSCAGTVPSQIGELRKVVASARRIPDAVLLTVGGNDILFSALVAHVIIGASTERTLFNSAGILASVADAQKILEKTLPGDFSKLRSAALKPLLGGDLSRVVFVSYGHPGLLGSQPCPGGRDGFDIHPAFAIDPARSTEVANFVSELFLPKLKALALCEGGVLCTDASDRMTFVDGHQRAFADHGFCARSQDDPAFDRDCFAADGTSFRESLVEGATDPLACSHSAREFRAYAARSRWIRTANDSYFIAMTYPEGLPSTMQPSDIHDATWGALSAVYGGALHPTAEGHAAMADAALPAVREVLGLPEPTQ